MNSWKASKNAAEPTERPHVLFIHYYFPPMGGGGVQRVVKFLKYWDLQRFRATLLTVKHSFSYSEDPHLRAEVPEQVTVARSGSADPFRILYLLRRFFGKKSMQKQKHSAKESGRLLRKLSNSLFIPDSRIGWLPFAVFKALRLHRSRRYALIIASMPPFTAGLIGAITSKLTGLPLILDYRDAWRENPYLPASGRFRRYCHHSLENFCLKHAKAVIFVNPALRDQYRLNYPYLQSTETPVIRNGYDLADFQELENDPGPSAGAFRLGIVGSIYSQGNRPRSLFKAIQQCLQNNPEFEQQFELHFVGKRIEELEHKIRQSQITSVVHFHPYLPHLDALHKAREFDALALVVEEGLPGSAALTPGRTYEHLALKRPILALCPPHSDVASLVRDCDAGAVIPYSDQPTIAKTLLDWTTNKTSFAEDFAFCKTNQYSRQAQTQQLMELIGRVLDANS